MKMKASSSSSSSLGVVALVLMAFLCTGWTIHGAEAGGNKAGDACVKAEDCESGSCKNLKCEDRDGGGGGGAEQSFECNIAGAKKKCSGDLPVCVKLANVISCNKKTVCDNADSCEECKDTKCGVEEAGGAKSGEACKRGSSSDPPRGTGPICEDKLACMDITCDGVTKQKCASSEDVGKLFKGDAETKKKLCNGGVGLKPGLGLVMMMMAVKLFSSVVNLGM